MSMLSIHVICALLFKAELNLSSNVQCDVHQMHASVTT